MPQKLTVEIINAAIAGFEQQKDRIEQQIADLRAMLPIGRIEAAITVNGSPRKRRGMSAAGKRAIAEAQRKRWAALKGQPEGKAPTPAPAKRKWRLSAAGRAAIIAATKKRWALKRALKPQQRRRHRPLRRLLARKVRLRLRQRRRRREPKYNRKLTSMVAAAVTGLLASSLLAMWASIGRFRLSTLPIDEFLGVLFWQLNPKLLTQRRYIVEVFWFKLISAMKPHHPFRRDTPDRMTGYRADTRK
jgi:hypothetical protein